MFAPERANDFWAEDLQWYSQRYLKSHGNDVKSPVTGKKATSYPLLKVKRMTLGTTDILVSPLPAWKDHGANCPGSYANVHDRPEADMEESAWLY